MKSNHKKPIIPTSVFTEAACKHFKCTINDIQIRMITESKEAFVIYQDEGYKISTREILRDDIEFALTDKDTAHYIDFGCWIEATKNTVELNKMLGALVKTLDDVEQAKMLLIAVGLGSYTQNAEVAFWEILSRIDCTGEMLGNAIVVTAQVYNGPGLIDDLLELQLLNGLSVYNMKEAGIFETIYADDDDKSPYPAFYIYSAEHSFSE